MNRMQIKDWELLKGIELKNTKGFDDQKNKIRNKYITKGEFRKGARKSNIVVKTEKGVAFLRGE